MYTWYHRAASGPPAAAMSSSDVVARVAAVIRAPAAAAPCAVATSPSGWDSLWNAVGATSTGDATEVPRTVVVVSTVLTSRSTRGRSRMRSHAATLSTRLTSSPAPPAR